MDDPNRQIEYLLQQGISAIKDKDKVKAREFLIQANDLDPTNIQVLFWLSAALEDPFEQEKSLQDLLELDPENQLAQKGLVLAQKRIIETYLPQGIEAAEQENYSLARQLLAEVVERDENNLTAWLWLSEVVDTEEDQEVCYNNILLIDPDNIDIQEKLDRLTSAKENVFVNPWLTDTQELDQPEQRMAPTLAGDILGDEFRAKHTTEIPEPEPEPEPLSTQLWMKYEDELGCPYCGNLTEQTQRRCSACNNFLWTSKHSSETRSILLWLVILLQLMTALTFAIIPLVIIFVVAQSIGVFNFFQLIPAYFGLASPLHSEIVASAFSILPRIQFYLSWLPAIIALMYTLALYLRWSPIYYFMLVSAILGLVGSIFGILSLPAFVGSNFAWGLAILISMITLVMVIKLESDFRKSRRRLYLKVDTELKDGIEYLLRGKQYGRNGMWALSAIHLRRAIGLIPYEADVYLAAAVACSHLHAYDLAVAVLRDAQYLDPHNNRIQQALELLITKQTSTSTETDMKLADANTVEATSDSISENAPTDFSAKQDEANLTD